MYYYVNILLTKNSLNTFISNENNFVQNQPEAILGWVDIRG